MWAGVAFGLTVLQVLLAHVRPYDLPLLGALHGINALLIFGVAVMAAMAARGAVPAGDRTTAAAGLTRGGGPAAPAPAHIAAVVAAVVVLGVPGLAVVLEPAAIAVLRDGHGYVDTGGGPPPVPLWRGWPTWRTAAASPRSPIRRPGPRTSRSRWSPARSGRASRPARRSTATPSTAPPPGPQITAAFGQLVEVRLVNAGVPAGVVLHWHGVEVPGAMDGTAGVTQDAVRPGGEFVYRFRATQPALLVPLPPGHPRAGRTRAVRRAGHHAARAGRRCGRARARAPLRGPPHRQRPGGRRARHGGAGHPGAGAGGEHRRGPDAGVADARRVPGRRRRRPRGARPHPAGATRPSRSPPGGGPTWRWSPHRRGRRSGSRSAGTRRSCSAPRRRRPRCPPTTVDMLTYGTPAPLGFDPAAADRRFDLRDRAHLRLHGRAPRPLVDGQRPPLPGRADVRGARGRRRHDDITNTSGEVHPMHLHGHHAVVLARDGVPATGARGGSTPSTSRTASPSTSRSSPTTRASGWITATSSSTPRTASSPT